ncbi:hypothetical protein CERZMDRAFT_87701 [Cercospora zeae-maydis SCOH1-5]|uniref:Uncharacterized protein n=1 Tax=Cercospora zeae-maydis SCOH1-5 TaxID=717836 RepID=A0A6A6F7Z6_9PEZI|nr:hypothetical protein CERZMDRAFT_87701 [Cercospora zeae-maydis SCOH1-5]
MCCLIVYQSDQRSKKAYRGIHDIIGDRELGLPASHASDSGKTVSTLKPSIVDHNHKLPRTPISTTISRLNAKTVTEDPATARVNHQTGILVKAAVKGNSTSSTGRLIAVPSLIDIPRPKKAVMTPATDSRKSSAARNEESERDELRRNPYSLTSNQSPIICASTNQKKNFSAAAAAAVKVQVELLQTTPTPTPQQRQQQRHDQPERQKPQNSAKTHPFA